MGFLTVRDVGEAGDFRVAGDESQVGIFGVVDYFLKMDLGPREPCA